MGQRRRKREIFWKLTKRSRCRSAGFIRPTCGRSGCSGLHVVTCNAVPWACAYVPHCHRHTTGADSDLIKFLPINLCISSAILTRISRFRVTLFAESHQLTIGYKSRDNGQCRYSLIGADYIKLSPECHFHSSGLWLCRCVDFAWKCSS